MSELGYFTVTDVKHYAYCPTILYITHVLGVRERVTEYMARGKELEAAKKHIPFIAKKYRAERVLRVGVIKSDRLRLVGKPDYVLLAPHGELIPVDVKDAEPLKTGRAKTDHVMQLTAYALLLEEKTGRTVKRGAILYLRPQSRVVEVNISYEAKRRLRKILKDMWGVVSSGVPPRRAVGRRCSGCNYRRYCPHI